ncbi:MAG: hypothetical protein D6820_00675 [Lentisphaerae bacterium]|nr:MAG: hypothetical protein D6820_00675 [Lentisphaerota bacterium]
MGEKELIDFFNLILGAGILLAIAVFLILAIVLCVLQVIFLMIGARFAGIEDRSFGKALMAIVLNIFFGTFLSILLGKIHLLLGVFAFFLVPCLFIKWSYSCSWIKAILAYIFAFIASIVFFLVTFVGIPLAISQSDSKEKVDHKPAVKTQIIDKDSKNKKSSNARSAVSKPE